MGLYVRDYENGEALGVQMQKISLGGSIVRQGKPLISFFGGNGEGGTGEVGRALVHRFRQQGFIDGHESAAPNHLKISKAVFTIQSNDSVTLST